MTLAEKVKARVSLRDVVSDYGVELKLIGSRWVALCPFHAEKTASFGVHRSERFYKCFGCGECGDLFKFVQLIEGVTFAEALNIVVTRYGITHHEQRPLAPKAEYVRASQLAKRATDIRTRAQRALIGRLLRLRWIRHRIGEHLRRVSRDNEIRWRVVDYCLFMQLGRVESALVTVSDAHPIDILAAEQRLQQSQVKAA